MHLEAEAQPFQLLPSLNTQAKSSPASAGSREVVLAGRLTPWEETQTHTGKSSRIRRRAHCNQTAPSSELLQLRPRGEQRVFYMETLGDNSGIQRGHGPQGSLLRDGAWLTLAPALPWGRIPAPAPTAQVPEMGLQPVHPWASCGSVCKRGRVPMHFLNGLCKLVRQLRRA